MRTKEETLSVTMNEFSAKTENERILAAMDEYAKEVSIDFFKWNALKVDEYINYLDSVNKADGITDKQKEADHFEGSTIAGRFEIYQQEKSSLK